MKFDAARAAYLKIAVELADVLGIKRPEPEDFSKRNNMRLATPETPQPINRQPPRLAKTRDRAANYR